MLAKDRPMPKRYQDIRLEGSGGSVFFQRFSEDLLFQEEILVNCLNLIFPPFFKSSCATKTTVGVVLELSEIRNSAASIASFGKPCGGRTRQTPLRT